MQRDVGSSGEPKPGMNDATLKAKVETELFPPADAPKGRVAIGVVDGVVELRGTAETQRQIRDLECRARGMPEVRDGREPG
jgi:osmotically-inducible protein OsmY